MKSFVDCVKRAFLVGGAIEMEIDWGFGLAGSRNQVSGAAEEFEIKIWFVEVGTFVEMNIFPSYV